MTSSQKKRLFEQICEHLHEPVQKRSRFDSIYFNCPECRACPLTPCDTGVCCRNCNLTITLDCTDLTRNAIDRMMQMVQSQHSGCMPASGTGTTTSTSKASPLVLPDDQVYLSWTCPGCNQLEILL